MSPGIRATVEFTTADICPIVELSETVDATIDSVNSNICPPNCTDSVVEFSVDADHEPETDLTPIFSSGSRHRYRFTLDDDSSCPCEVLGQFGCLVARYVAQNGTLTLGFYAADYDQLQAIVAELRERYPEMDIKRFARSPADARSEDRIAVNRGKLTARQLEVLETAYEMGYFERPRRANATEIASELDVNPSTFREHLSAAESKILGDIL